MNGQRGGIAGAALLLLLLLLLAACASGSSDEVRSVEDVVGVSLTDDEMRASLLNEYRIKEELIAECMEEYGFDYIAWVEEPVLPGGAVGADLDGRSYAEQYGFGVSTIEPERPPVNPNVEIRAALSAAEAEAYDRALHGQLPTGDLAVSEVSDRTVGAPGCQQYAFDMFRPDVDGPSPEQMDAFYVLLESIDERTDGDARVLEVVAAAEACLAGKGYAGVTETEIVDHFLREAAEIASMENVSLAGMKSAGVGDAVIAEVQAFERTYAAAAWDCFAPTTDVISEVRAEIEEEVVADNLGVFLAARSGLRQNSPIVDPNYRPSR